MAYEAAAETFTMIITVYIGAVGRSGTTLLERTLATSPRVTAVGEVVHLWNRGVRDDEPCGCGDTFLNCAFWTKVGVEAFGGWDRVDLIQLDLDRAIVDRNRYIPYLLLPQLAPPRFRASQGRLVDVLGNLYRGIAAAGSETGGDFIIDSSKHPSYLFLMRRVPGVDLRLLHVVRDPRGVAHSWSKRVMRPENGAPMEQLGSVRASLRWLGHNLLFELATRIGVRSERLPYEAFTADPTVLARSLDRLVPGGSPTKLAIVSRSITLGVDHTVSGNPLRFAAGSVELRADESWRTSLSKRSRLTIGVVTTPFRQLWARP